MMVRATWAVSKLQSNRGKIIKTPIWVAASHAPICAALGESRLLESFLRKLFNSMDLGGHVEGMARPARWLAQS